MLFCEYHIFLEGQLSLTHNKSEPVHLKPQMIDQFDGGDDTVSEGTATDFNVMFRKDINFDVAVEPLNLFPAEKKNLAAYAPAGIRSFLFIYAYDANVEFSKDNTTLNLKKGDIVFVEFTEKDGVSSMQINNCLNIVSKLAMVRITM